MKKKKLSIYDYTSSPLIQRNPHYPKTGAEWILDLTTRYSQKKEYHSFNYAIPRALEAYALKLITKDEYNKIVNYWYKNNSKLFKMVKEKDSE